MTNTPVNASPMKPILKLVRQILHLISFQRMLPKISHTEIKYP